MLRDSGSWEAPPETPRTPVCSKSLLSEWCTDRSGVQGIVPSRAWRMPAG